MNGTAKEILGNIGTIRAEPSRYGVDTGKRVPPLSVIEFVAVVSAIVKGTADSPSDQWFRLPDGNYLNYILSGKPYFQILTHPNTEPVTSRQITLTVEEAGWQTVSTTITQNKT